MSYIERCGVRRRNLVKPFIMRSWILISSHVYTCAGRHVPTHHLLCVKNRQNPVEKKCNVFLAVRSASGDTAFCCEQLSSRVHHSILTMTPSSRHRPHHHHEPEQLRGTHRDGRNNRANAQTRISQLEKESMQKIGENRKNKG